MNHYIEGEREVLSIDDAYLTFKGSDLPEDREKAIALVRELRTETAKRVREEERQRFTEGLAVFLDGLMNDLPDETKAVLLHQLQALSPQSESKTDVS